MTMTEGTDRERAGARIRELRQAAGLSQQALANKLGCTQPHIANLESGRDRVTDQTRDALYALFGERVA